MFEYSNIRIFDYSPRRRPAFLPRDAMLARYMLSAFVRPSVRLYDTRLYCTKTANTRITHVNITLEMRRRKRHARCAPFVNSCGMSTYDRHVWIYIRPEY